MRVLSLHPAMTELAFALGAGGELVGRTDACLHPDAALKVPSIGPLADVSEVVVDVFEPTLVLTGPGQQELARALGARRSVISYDPQSLDEVFAGIASLGESLGKQVEADMLAYELRLVVHRAQESARRFRPMRVYCEVAHAPPTAASGYIAQLIAACGASVFEGEATPERIAAFDPQAILSCVAHQGDEDVEIISARDGWQGVSAVRYERVFSVPSPSLHHPGPRLAEGVRAIARLLHGIDLARQQ